MTAGHGTGMPESECALPLFIYVNKRHKQCALGRNCSLGICVRLLLRQQLVSKELLFTYGAHHYLPRDPHHLRLSTISNASHSVDAKRYRTRFVSFRFDARTTLFRSLFIRLRCHFDCNFYYDSCSCMCRWLRSRAPLSPIRISLVGMRYKCDICMDWDDSKESFRVDRISESFGFDVRYHLWWFSCVQCSLFFHFGFGADATFAHFPLPLEALLSTLEHHHLSRTQYN